MGTRVTQSNVERWYRVEQRRKRRATSSTTNRTSPRTKWPPMPNYSIKIERAATRKSSCRSFARARSPIPSQPSRSVRKCPRAVTFVMALFIGMVGDDSLARLATMPRRPNGSSVSAMIVGSTGLDASATLERVAGSSDHRGGAFVLRSTTQAYRLRSRRHRSPHERSRNRRRRGRSRRDVSRHALRVAHRRLSNFGHAESPTDHTRRFFLGRRRQRSFLSLGPDSSGSRMSAINIW